MYESKHILRITHVITGLRIGGAESMLYKLVRQHKQENVQITVVSLGEVGQIGERIRALGISVEAVGARSGSIPRVFEVIKLITKIRREKPEVLQGWMYHGNIAATLGGLFLIPRPKIFWNVRQSLGPLDQEKNLTKNLIRFSAFLSRIPDGIIYNSMDSVEQHTAIGYSSKRIYFIPNGFDPDEFRPDNIKRQQVRAELGISDDSFLVGHIARFHPKKDHHSFFAAAKHVLQKRNDVYFLAAGRGVFGDNPTILRQLQEFGLQNKIFLLGERNDISSIYCALDLFVSSSAWGEGFPNNIGEAMATGLCCAATDVGESKRLLGETGQITGPSDPRALASVILEFVANPFSDRQKRGQEARKRVSERYSIEHIGGEYMSLYTENLMSPHTIV